MTSFERRAHWRMGRRGKPSYVRQHSVSRSDWERYPHVPMPDPIVAKFGQLTGPTRWAVRYLTPNAHCPVCHAPVFYYQNKHGSRVFFDDVGPPWPKHPCTYTGADQSTFARGEVSPHHRSFDDIVQLTNWYETRGVDPTADFRSAHHSEPWPLAVIAKRFKGQASVFFVLKVLQEGPTKKVFASCLSLPKCCKPGFTIALNRGSISSIDSLSMQPKMISIKRFRNASGFIDAMLSSGTSDT